MAMATNIDLLNKMLSKNGYQYSFIIDEIEVELDNGFQVLIKDDNTAYEIIYKGNLDVAHDEMEVICILEKYK